MNKKNIVILSLILIISISIIIYEKLKYNYDYENIKNEDIFISENTTNNNNNENMNLQDSTKIKVHITGEINNPGLYELDENSRINDLILLAGGKTETADLNKVNLAYTLSDGEKIYIPSIFDEVSTYIYNDAGENVIESSDTLYNTKQININKATTSDFQQISGIGPNLAQKIIDYRNSIGKFNSIEELKNVSGIGDKKFETIKECVCVK